MRATIKDIAAKANLSVTTVSLVLNDKPCKIPEETRRLVQKIAEEMNYHPNQLAVGLIKKRTQTIGLIVSDISNSFFAGLTKGIENECRKNHRTLIVCNSNDQFERDLEYITVLASKNADGIVYCMSRDTDLERFYKVQSLLDQFAVPYVMLDRSFDLPGVYIVRVDHVTGGHLATSHLLGLGHRRIACVTGPMNLVDSRDRLQGYRKALAEYGVPFDEELIIEGTYEMESGILASDTLQDRDFSAIFAFDDMMAYGVYQGLKKHGLSIPEDVSVVGYDDIFPSAILDVPLTTVHQPIRRLGEAAVRKLLAVIDNNGDVEASSLLVPELVVRKSTAPPRRG